MLDITIDTSEMERKVETLIEETRLNFGDFRDLFFEFDAWLTQHLKKNFDREGPHWRGLARSTINTRRLALERGDALVKWKGRWKSPSSYYRLNRPLRRVSLDHPIGQWTGRARRRAIKKGKAQRKKYTRDFGPKDANRDRLRYLHIGGPHRAPRPLYRKRVLERNFVRMAEAYAKAVVQVIEQKVEELGISKRLMERFL